MTGHRLSLLHIGAALCASLALSQPAFAQAPDAAPPADGPPRGPMTIEADPRVEQRTYRFADTDEDLGYTVYVSSRADPATPAPLIVALHGLGGDSNFIVRERLVDLAEENGYIVVGPLGYNTGGWYGSPLVRFGDQPAEPANLTELSEKDVMTVLAMAKEEFNVDPDRIYLMGHSMGGAGTIFLGQKYADQWAALAAIAPAAFMMQRSQQEILGPIHEAGLPIIVTQGDMDTAVPVENTRTWAAAMAEMGMEHEYVEMPGRGHGFDIIGDGMPDIFRFFAAHRRGD